MAEKGDELVQYITEKVVHYMQTPRKERKMKRQLRRANDPWLSRWFGVVPFALSMWLEQWKKKRKRR